MMSSDGHASGARRTRVATLALAAIWVCLVSDYARAQLTTGTVNFDVETLHALTEFTVGLSDGSSLTIEKDYVVDHSPDSYTWVGTVQSEPGSSAVITVSKPNALGSIETIGHRWTLTLHPTVPVPIEELDPSSSFPEAPPSELPIFSDGFEGEPFVAGALEVSECDDDPSRIDLLVLYTNAAAAAASAAGRDIVKEIQNAVTQANSSFLRSRISALEPDGIELSFRLVHTEAVEFDEQSAGNIGAVLDKLQDGEIGNAKSLRDQFNADLVTLLVSDKIGDYYGVASIVTVDAPDFAYSVVARVNLAEHDMTHELGHLFGADHDKNAPNHVGASETRYGYVHLNGSSSWRTIMAYEVACEALDLTCSRLGIFSSPDYELQNGDPTGESDTDNRGQLINRAQEIACYRDAPAHEEGKVPAAERDALVALYSSTDGHYWTDNSNWLIGDPCTNNWTGITCDANSNVTSIQLPFNNLVGGLPSELGDLTKLQGLWLSSNQLSGPIPTELGNLSNLRELLLEYNQLSGPIPAEFGNLANLQSLWLGLNQLSGPIPAELGNLANLQWLVLYDNQLSGAIPAELGNLLNLQGLWLRSNQLSGPIPAELSVLANLRELVLSVNQLSGPIPAELGNLANLERLELSGNQLSGPIPSELGDLSSLQGLELSVNQLSGSIPAELANLSNLSELSLRLNNMSGPIPSELGDLANLQWLELGGNQLSGPIPSELGGLSNLQVLGLWSNQLTGSIPAELFVLANLRGLFLFENQLSGPISPEFGNLANLEWLNLGVNQLSGSIPPELGDIANLRGLYLNFNQLSGSIPPELGNLANLQWLVLHYNQLSGAIPAELGNLSNLWELFLHGNQLSGPIPAELGNLSKLHRLYLDGNRLSGPIPTELGNLSALDDSDSDLRWNLLYTSDTSLDTFLDSKQREGNWSTEQTVAPTNLSVVDVGVNSVTLSWDAIEYTGNEGRYRVWCSTSEGGPYADCGTTTSKTITSLDVGGLVGATTYYFVIRTETDSHSNNQNNLVSDPSEEVSATTL